MGDLATLNFDASQVEPSVGFEPVPEAAYTAVITKSEVKPTAKGDGTYMAIVCEVVDGPYKGRKVFEQITIKNNNAEAQKIGMGTLSALCRAVGVLTPKDSHELIGKPFIMDVGLEKRKDTGALKNRIKAYKAVGAGNVAGTVVNGSSKPATPEVPPWERKAG